MLFNSIEYFLFLIVFLSFFYLIGTKLRWILTLAASYFFYGFWNIEYLGLIVFSTIVDYYCSNKISNSIQKTTRKFFLLISIITNLGLLAFFKYYNFFIDNINSSLQFMGMDYSMEFHSLILPVGISFYTFQTMSYTIDVYTKKITAENNFGKFALYVTFFPQLVAGPIERAQALLPQINNLNTKFKFKNFESGISKIIIGLFKKVVVADLAAIYVNTIYNHYEIHNGGTLLLATYIFAFQIYCDFSGYSDIAIGSAKLFGVDLLENFNTPYFSKSITEFWRRWHISLSFWLRDYLYIPLGGNRYGKFKTYFNLLVTMLLGGLWHGASWNFIIWGGINGLYLAIEKKLKFISNPSNKVLTFLRIILTFNLICLTWIFFRASNFEQSQYIITNIVTNFSFQFSIRDFNIFVSLIINMLFLLGYELYRIKYKENNALIVFIMFFLLILFGVSEGNQFIYFQF